MDPPVRLSCTLLICTHVIKFKRIWKVRVETVHYKERLQFRLLPNPNYFGQTWTKMKYQRKYNNVSIQCNYATLVVCTTRYLQWQIYEKKYINSASSVSMICHSHTYLLNKYPPRIFFTLHLLSHAMQNNVLMKFVK